MTAGSVAAPPAGTPAPGADEAVAARSTPLSWFADLPRWAGGILGAVIVVIIWWLLAITVFRASGAVPTPVAVVRQVFDDGAGVYWRNASVTTWSAIKGYLWGNGLAFVLSVIVLLLPFLEGVAQQVAVVTYCIPLTAIEIGRASCRERV